MSDKIKIRIQCSERVLYDQTVEMTCEQWCELKATPEHTMEHEDMSPLPLWVELSDPLGSRGFEDIEMEVVDDDNDPVKPIDCYEGGA